MLENGRKEIYGDICTNNDGVGDAAEIASGGTSENDLREEVDAEGDVGHKHNHEHVHAEQVCCHRDKAVQRLLKPVSEVAL